jgi:thioredoxin 2
MSDTRQIVCPHCDAVNRVPMAKPALKAKCGRCHKQLFTGSPVQVSAKSFQVHTQNSDIPVLVDFRAEWCEPCKMMEPVLQRLAGELEPELRILEVDTEQEQHLAAQYNIRSIPMMILFRRGSILAQRAGAVDANTLRNWLCQYTSVSSAA